MISRAYGEYQNNAIYGNVNEIYCESKIFDSEEFGYNKVEVECPMREKDGNRVIKNGKVQPDITLRDTENIPLSEEIDKYFEREILPYIPDAWIDKKKIKVGYEIPMTRYFYKFPKVESASEIARRLERLEAEIAESLKILFHTED